MQTLAQNSSVQPKRGQTIEDQAVRLLPEAADFRRVARNPVPSEDQDALLARRLDRDLEAAKNGLAYSKSC